MALPQVAAGYSPSDIVLTPLQGDNTQAARELRKALKSMTEVRGKAGVKALLTALAAAN